MCLVTVAAVCGASLSSCGVAPGAEVSVSMDSEPRPEPRSELTDPEMSDPGMPGPDLSEPGLEDLLPPELLDPDGTVPGLEGASQQCIELSSAYSTTIVLAFAGDPDGELPGLFDQLEAAAPTAVREDLEVVRRIVTEASEGGLIDATGALISDEFVDANASVVDWLASLCADGGA
jgi:hypothetical protein